MKILFWIFFKLIYSFFNVSPWVAFCNIRWPFFFSPKLSQHHLSIIFHYNLFESLPVPYVKCLEVGFASITGTCSCNFLCTECQQKGDHSANWAAQITGRNLLGLSNMDPFSGCSGICIWGSVFNNHHYMKLWGCRPAWRQCVQCQPYRQGIPPLMYTGISGKEI